MGLSLVSDLILVASRIQIYVYIYIHTHKYVYLYVFVIRERERESRCVMSAKSGIEVSDGIDRRQ